MTEEEEDAAFIRTCGEALAQPPKTMRETLAQIEGWRVHVEGPTIVTLPVRMARYWVSSSDLVHLGLLEPGSPGIQVSIHDTRTSRTVVSFTAWTERGVRRKMRKWLRSLPKEERPPEFLHLHARVTDLKIVGG